MILSFPADIKLTKDCLPPLPSPSSLLTQQKKLKSDLFTTKSSPFSYSVTVSSAFCNQSLSGLFL